MSDFDNKFRDLMNEEESFPRRDENWQRLVGQLETPKPLPKPAKLWASKTALSLAAAGVLVASLVWYLIKSNTENTALKARIEHLETEVQAVKTRDLPNANGSTTVVHDTVFRTSIVIQNKNQKTAKSAENTLKSNDIQATKPNTGSKSNSTDPSVSGQSEAVLKTKATEKVISKNDIKNESTILNKINGNKNETSENAPNQKDDVIAQTQSDKITPNNAENRSSQTNIKSREKLLNNVENRSENKTLNSESQVENKAQQTDLATSKLTDLKVLDAKKTVLLSIEKDKFEPLSINDFPIIQRTMPTISSGWLSGLALGVNSFTTFSPQDKRSGSLVGAGVTAEMDVLARFRVVASADWGTLDYDSGGHEPRRKGPKPPKEPKPNEEIRRVEGHQDQQQFGLSVKYLFPTKGWLQPMVSLGYAYRRFSEQTARFSYVNTMTNTETLQTAVQAPQYFNNLWQVGVGAEKKWRHFGVAVSLDYQKDLSLGDFDNFILRGGLRYRF